MRFMGVFIYYKSFFGMDFTAVSLMLNHGISPLIVAKRLGRSKVSITLDTYGHLLPGMQQ